MSEVALSEKLETLLAGQLTYKVIAERAGCDISTIYRIKTGSIANPSYSVGIAIDAMYAEAVRKTAA